MKSFDLENQKQINKIGNFVKCKDCMTHKLGIYESFDSENFVHAFAYLFYHILILEIEF